VIGVPCPDDSSCSYTDSVSYEATDSVRGGTLDLIWDLDNDLNLLAGGAVTISIDEASCDFTNVCNKWEVITMQSSIDYHDIYFTLEPTPYDYSSVRGYLITDPYNIATDGVPAEGQYLVRREYALADATHLLSQMSVGQVIGTYGGNLIKNQYTDSFGNTYYSLESTSNSNNDDYLLVTLDRLPTECYDMTYLSTSYCSSVGTIQTPWVPYNSYIQR